MKIYIKEKAGDIALTSPGKVCEEFKALSKADQESFWLLGLNQANKGVLKECIFLGGLSECMIDIKIIFRRLLQAGCAQFICIHNHPGGCFTPSKYDNEITNRIKEAGKIIDLPLLDHIIIGDGYFSYKENNRL